MKLFYLALIAAGAVTSCYGKPLHDPMSGPWPMVSEGGQLVPDDGIFHVDGNWSVPYGGAQPVLFLQSLATFTGGSKNHLQMAVPAGLYEGSEIASDAAWTFDGKTFPYGQVGTGYGYYEVTMKTANVGNSTNNTGVVDSFFLKGAPCCKTQEVDFEFLTNETWLQTPTGAVHCTLHYPGGTISRKVSLPFNPSAGPHRYGFLWTPDGTVKFYADRQLIDTESNAAMTPPTDGMLIMANAWTGNPNWGGLPPAGDAVATYADFNYWANITHLP